ncbi:uncharacterized protein TNCV_4141761 [Trichonephila clavipes]|nr:uncharacterized protein TNCV_4141761 [Trichonephila clavipes]
MGSYPGEDMDVCKCIVPLRHGDTLNSRLAANPLVRLVEREERWEASDYPQSVLPLNWGGTEPNSSVTCMVLKAAAIDKRHLALCHDAFRGPRSGLCRSVGISNNKNNRFRALTNINFRVFFCVVVRRCRALLPLIAQRGCCTLNLSKSLRGKLGERDVRSRVKIFDRGTDLRGMSPQKLVKKNYAVFAL